MSFNKSVPFVKPATNITQSPPDPKNITESPASQKNIPTARPLTYTFYHPSHTQSTATLPTNKQFQRREYRYVSQSFGGSKPAGNRTVPHQAQKLQKNELSSKNYGFRIVSREVIQTPQTKAKEQAVYYSANPTINSAFSLSKQLRDTNLQVKKVSSYEEIKQMTKKNMVESTIIQGKTGETEGKGSTLQNQTRYRNQIQKSQSLENSLKTSVRLTELSYEQLTKKSENSQAKIQQLQSQNLNMSQQLLANQTLIRSYQQKLQALSQEKNQLFQKSKKVQQSLKISRNIISTLNQKIARNLRESEANLKCVQQKYQSELQQITNNHQQATKRLQSTVFELKLKIIDQANAMQEAISKAEQQFKANAQKQKQQILLELTDSINARQFSQLQVRRLSQILTNLQSDLIRLDQQNIRMDQQFGRLLQINAEFEHANIQIRMENQQLGQEIRNLTSFLEQLRLQNTCLKERGAHVDVDLQKELLATKVAHLETEIEILRTNNQQYKKQISIVINQRQALLQQIEQKDGQIAKLNISKGSLMLQNLKIKEKVKRRESNQSLTNYEDIHLEETTRLQTQIASIKTQLETYKVQNWQKQQGLNELLRRKDLQLQTLSAELAKREAQIASQIRYQHFKPSEYLEGQIIYGQIQYTHITFERTELQPWKQQYSQKISQLLRLKDITKEMQLQAQQSASLIQHQSIRIKDLQNQLNLKTAQIQHLSASKMSHITATSKTSEQRTHQIRLLLEQMERSDQHSEMQAHQIVALQQQLGLQGRILQGSNMQPKDKLEQQNRKLYEQLSQHIQAISQQNTQIAHLQQQLDHLQQQLDHLQQQPIPPHPPTYQLSHHNPIPDTPDELLSYKLTQLSLELAHSNSIIDQQRITIEMLNQELQMQEQDYRTMLEQQINKINMIYSQSATHPDSPTTHSPDSPTSHSPDSPTNHPQQATGIQTAITQQSLQESPNSSYSSQLEQMNREELISRLRELQVTNRSYKSKVEEINCMEDNLNAVIIGKLKLFEHNLEKNEHEKHQLEQKADQLTEELQIMSEKCQHYEAKIEWVDGIYKEVEASLAETVEELITVQLSYLNLKLMLRQDKKFSQTGNNIDRIIQLSGLVETENEPNTVALTMTTSQDIFNDGTTALEPNKPSGIKGLFKQFELRQIAESRELCEAEDNQQHQPYPTHQTDTYVHAGVTQLSQKLSFQTCALVESREYQPSSFGFQYQPNNMMEEEDPLAGYGFPSAEEGQLQNSYYVKQAKYGSEVYEIKVSHIDSESEGSEHDLEKQQAAEQNYQILQQWVDQMEQADRRVGKKQTQPPEQECPISDFIMRTIKKLEAKDKTNQQGETNPSPLVQEEKNSMSDYIMRMIKNVQEMDRKNEGERQEQEKFQCHQVSPGKLQEQSTVKNGCV